MAKLIIDIDEKLHSKFKVFAASKGMTLKELVTDYVSKCVGNMK